MKFENSSVTSTPEILKRKLGGELIVPMTLTADAKAGSPISADGAVANDATAVGILLEDVVVAENPNGAVVKAFATINEANGEANTGLTYADAMKSALTQIVFE